MTRHEARERVLQTLFQLDVNEVSSSLAAEYTHSLLDGEQDGDGFFLQLLEGVVSHKLFLDEIISSYAEDWTIDRMPGVDRNILRIGCYELVFIEETPSAVIVNEAVELSKHFGTDQSSKFVNGVLAGVLRNLSDLRINAKGQTPQ